MSFKRIFHRQYMSLLDVAAPDEVPDPARRYFVNFVSLEAITFIRRLVGDAKRVLVVGDFGGRDYYSLRLLGKEVFVLDIAPQRDIPHLVLGDVTQSLPFPNSCFDAVVIGEVLEHLVEDHVALANLYQILKRDGRLIVTVPCLDDWHDVHVRVHTPTSILRLLRACGFVPIRVIQRGGLISFSKGTLWMVLFHGFCWLAYRLTGRVLQPTLLQPLIELDWRLGLAGFPLLRWSRSWGVYVLCAKGQPEDFRKLNVEKFSQYSWATESETDKPA